MSKAGGTNLRMEPIPDTAIATATPAAAPAGGTGATVGAYDTAAHRDDAIVTINGLRSCVIEIKAELDALRALIEK